MRWYTVAWVVLALACTPKTADDDDDGLGSPDGGSDNGEDAGFDGGDGGGGGSDTDGACVAIDEESFAVQYSVAFCELMDDCDPDGFETLFGNDEKCHRYYRNVQENQAVEMRANDCVFDDEQAVECVEEIQAISCGEWQDNGLLSCETVYIC